MVLEIATLISYLTRIGARKGGGEGNEFIIRDKGARRDNGIDYFPPKFFPQALKNEFFK